MMYYKFGAWGFFEFPRIPTFMYRSHIHQRFLRVAKAMRHTKKDVVRMQMIFCEAPSLHCTGRLVDGKSLFSLLSFAKTLIPEN